MQASQISGQAIDPAQHEAIRDELRRILESNAFRGSRRCCRFLEYSVDHVLAGGQEDLRERNIGIEVFHRSPDYDTAEDAVVRVTANEVRKRLAQYRLEAGSDSTSPIISLPPGSYAASFRWKPEAAPVEQEILPTLPTARRATGRWMLLSAPVALLLIAGLWWVSGKRAPAAILPRP